MRAAQSSRPRLLRRQGSGAVWEGARGLGLWNRAGAHIILSRGLGSHTFPNPAEDLPLSEPSRARLRSIFARLGSIKVHLLSIRDDI